MKPHTKKTITISTVRNSTNYLMQAIEEIRQVATGERQVGNDDTDGLDWIAKRIAAIKHPSYEDKL